MINKIAMAGLVVLFASAGSAMARGPATSERIGAFGKDGPQSRIVTHLADAPATQAAPKYVCPMGDSESDKPGKCAKCGMQLKKVENPKDHEKHQH